MIVNADWETILDTASDFSLLCEIYPSDQAPTVDGFDPADAVGLYAAVDGDGIVYAGQSYARLVSSFGNVTRNISGEANSCEVEFSNVGRTISRFEFNTGFEGLVMVIRLISRSLSTSLAKSQILFTGRCDKPDTGNKASLTVSATWILGGTEVLIPRRKYSKDDQEGRVASDPEFEGFLNIPTNGTASYPRQVSRGGILGLFGFKKTIQQTLQYSSYSDLDANKDVPEVFGRAQIIATNIGYVDIGTTLQLRAAFCEGPIYSIDGSGADTTHAISTDPRLPIDPYNYNEALGLVGAANSLDPSYVSYQYYSRTAQITAQIDNSTVDAVDPAPDIAAIISGRLMTIPDGGGDWVTTDEWTDNGAAHTRFLITDQYYWNLDENWLADDEFYTTYIYNAQAIIDHSLTDFLFVVPG